MNVFMTVAAKWLREAGHQVVVFEKAAQVGGVWKYEDATDTDASMYKVICFCCWLLSSVPDQRHWL